MQIQSLRLAEFRNFHALELDLQPGFSVFFGPNGAGKTNLIEAIYYLSSLKSFRTHDNVALISHQVPRARLEVIGQENHLPVRSRLAVTLERQIKGCQRRLLVDDKACRSAFDFVGKIPLVLFTPEDLHLVRGAPTARRHLLDRAAFAHEPSHLRDVQNYEKALRMRTAVLRNASEAMPTIQRSALLDSYDETLADSGARIMLRRRRWLAAIEPLAQSFFGQIHDGDGITMPLALRYTSKSPMVDDNHAGQKAELLRVLGQQRSLDLVRKTTSRGPHLDDLRFDLAKEPAVLHASQGQTRAIVLALKLAELQLLTQKKLAPPVLLLDDVTSELDPQRSARFFALLPGHVGQCLITTTAAHFIAPHLALTSDRLATAFFAVQDGKVQAQRP